MKILALPRERTNPYQDLLYGEMQRLGAQVSYLGELTRSHTLNQLLLPFELVARRLAGAHVVHLHWTYAFRLHGSFRFPFLRRVAQAWFVVWLWTLRSVGLRLVWTAHNVLPVDPVFVDDLRVRRQIVAACDLVLAHSWSTLAQLAALGIVPCKSAVIPHGPYTPTLRPESLRTPGGGQGLRRFLFFGRVESYKGVDDLLKAFAALPRDLDSQLTVAGYCGELPLRAALTRLAQCSGRPVVLRLERISEEEVSELFEGADVVVLPYRKITTSGSAMLALSHGRPLIVPDMPGLAELPGDAVVRYDGSIDGLTRALTDLILADASVLAKMSDAANAFSAAVSWSEIAGTTLGKMSQIFSGKYR
jgi:glycosyltransferase involved in cell wall biosynthesis